VSDPVAVIGAVSARYRELGAVIDDLDGITVDLGQWWFNLRPSNTEPLLRLNLEAPNQIERDRHLEEVLGLIGQLADSEKR
jgi:phosphomannomutase